MNNIIEQVYCNPDIYKISVPLTGNALKNLNSYVILDHGESLVIDTGFRTEECYNTLMEGLRTLGLSPAHTSLFLSHLHSDHIGLAQYFNYPDTTIYMGKEEYSYYSNMISGGRNPRGFNGERFLAEGFPSAELEEAHRSNPARIYLPSETFPVRELSDQDKIKVGEVELTAILLPGHTPGLMCLYLEKEKIMFTADHVLFDITPNITSWPGMENPLARYIKSLEKVMTYDVKTVFPAHRNLSGKTMEQRIAEIIAHHTTRLMEVIDALKEKPGANAYEVAGKLTWSLRGRSWEDAPKKQKWFAVGETLAHLEYLEAQGRIRKDKENGYYLL